MPNKFFVQYKSSSTGAQIAAVEKELTSVGPGPIKALPDARGFDATLNWGCEPRDVRDLRLRLAAAVGVDVLTLLSPYETVVDGPAGADEDIGHS